MKKPKIKINRKDLTNQINAIGLTELLTYLKDSDLFDIDYHDERITSAKADRAAILHYNDKKIYLDVWEYDLPTYSKSIYRQNFDLIIKLFHSNSTKKHFLNWNKRKKIMAFVSEDEAWDYHKSIVPWTFVPSRLIQKAIKRRTIDKEYEITQDGFFYGVRWKTRLKMFESFKKQEIDAVESFQATRHRKLTDEKYLKKMKSSKYGIVLAGRGGYFTDRKNRREIDYMMIRKPLLINYRPNYYNPLEQDKHYIFINPETKINALENMYNTKEIEKSCHEWYKNNATPHGAAKVFKQIMDERL